MADLNKIIEDLSSLTVVEAAELSKQLEEKWGVTAATAVAAAPAAGGAPAAAEEKGLRDCDEQTRNGERYCKSDRALVGSLANVGTCM